MNKHLLYFVVVVILLLIISPNPTLSREIQNHKEQFNNYEEKSESGQRIFGMILLVYNNSTSEGLTDYNYKGYIHNINATFSSYTEFYMVHFILMDRSFVIKTNSTIKLSIDHFYGGIAHDPYNEDIQPNNSLMGGYGINIRWKIE